MSLFIIGLDVPKSCYDCVQNDKDDNCFYFLSNCQVWIEEICKGNIDCEDLPKDHRDITCPLSEVPTPHGDLVDRDDLIDEINRVTFVKRYDYDVAYNIVTDAETIIEAEVSE